MTIRILKALFDGTSKGSNPWLQVTGIQASSTQ